jgi:hypothetical protein
MFNYSKLILNKGVSITLKKNCFINLQKYSVSSKRQQTNFDIHADWYKNLLLGKKLSIARFLALVNFTIFLYVNFRVSDVTRYRALEGVSYSLINYKNKDYIPLFASVLGSYRIEDLIIETGILLTLGHKLEKLHGSSFMFKMFIFSYYMAWLSSLFFITKPIARRDRYYEEHPQKKDLGTPNSVQYKFLSQHSTAMSLVYFFMFKNSMKKFIIPLFALDLLIWGPMYSPGALTGIAAGMIL